MPHYERFSDTILVMLEDIVNDGKARIETADKHLDKVRGESGGKTSLQIAQDAFKVYCRRNIAGKTIPRKRAQIAQKIRDGAAALKLNLQDPDVKAAHDSVTDDSGNIIGPAGDVAGMQIDDLRDPNGREIYA